LPETATDSAPSPPPLPETKDEHHWLSEEPTTQHVPDALGPEDDADLDEEFTDETSCDPQAIAAWESLVAELVALHGRASLPPWFDQLAGGELAETTLTVLVPNSTAANHLNETFGADLTRLWRERAGEGAVVQVAMDLRSDTRAALIT
jgi:hypothetical protein